MTLSELVLSHTDNEATAIPIWFIACRAGAAHRGRQVMIRGFWFNREDAERHLNAKRHRYPKTAYVYCDSGHDSWHIKELYALARAEKDCLPQIVRQVVEGE